MAVGSVSDGRAGFHHSGRTWGNLGLLASDPSKAVSRTVGRQTQRPWVTMRSSPGEMYSTAAGASLSARRPRGSGGVLLIHPMEPLPEGERLA